MSSPALLEVKELSVSLGGTPILNGINMQVHRGQMLAVVGPNGAGKSTLLAALAGDHNPHRSSSDKTGVFLEGRPITTYSAGELARKRAVLRQSTPMAFPFSVLDVVKMGRAPWRRHSSAAEDELIIAEEMVRADVLRFAERRFPSLSGGERARVSLARVLAQRTEVILLDEPTAALDLNYQEQVLAVARRCARRGAGVVVVLHDLSAAASYADIIVLLSQGRVRAFGPPAEVLTADTLTDVYGHPIRVHIEDDGAITVTPLRFADDKPHCPRSQI